MKNNNTFIKIIHIFTLVCLIGLGACNDYLDIVPEGTGTMENAFTSREAALRYLYSNYSFLQRVDPMSGLEVTGVGELIYPTDPRMPVPNSNVEPSKIAHGKQSPYVNLYNRWHYMYIAINNCNTAISGLKTYHVPNLPDWERDAWIAENKVLKAWYHFYLLRMYGPIPVIRENLPISTDVNKVQVPREPVDSVVNYIVQLLDEAIPYLLNNTNIVEDYGRINKAIAMSIKALVLVTAASPLFNCNEEQAPLKNKDGQQLFPQDKGLELSKWQRAAEACDAAVKFCMQTLNMKLYTYPGHPNFDLTPTILQQLTLRQAFCERWNSEVIWAYTGSGVNDLQIWCSESIGPHNDPRNYCMFGIPLSIVEQFYSSNGVPISEDKQWKYDTRYNLRTAVSAENLNIREGEKTARMNFDREARYYAWMAFDRGVFYGWGFEDDSSPANLLYVRCRKGEPMQGVNYGDNESEGMYTGYYPKKYIHFKTQGVSQNQMAVEYYIWPLIRLPELLLYYAEALNEAEDTPEARSKAMQYVDIIRQRAGLKTIAESWTTYSNNPTKYKTQDGLRKIIQQERNIELVFEGKRYWDLRRWKIAPEVLNASVLGFNMGQSKAEYFYKPYVLFQQSFGLKDYFFPISDDELRRNQNLVQNLGW